jgi:hypothetical protein
MNDHLERLLRSAANGTRPDRETEVPFALETRVLASWRASRNSPALSLWDSVYRPALLLAGGIMIASLALNIGTLTHYRDQLTQNDTELSVADSALHLALAP